MINIFHERLKKMKPEEQVIIQLTASGMEIGLTRGLQSLSA